MRTLYENKYTCTQEIYEEIYKHFYFRHPLYLGIGIALIVFALFTNTISLSSMSTVNIPTVLYLVVYFVLLNVMARVSAKKRYQSDLKENMNKPLTATFLIREDAVALKFSNSAAITTSYSEIYKVTHTKNLIMLVTKEKVSLTLKKDGFKNGSLEEFKKFLSSKKLQLK